MLNLGWGYPICVKEVLDLYYKPNLLLSPVIDMDYPEYAGKDALVEHIKKLTCKQYIVITSGAAQAINIILRSFKQHEPGRITVNTNKHTFPYYSYMIVKAGFKQQTIICDTLSNKVLNLVDMPSNPWGLVHKISDPGYNVIWDGVYCSKTYINSTVGKNVSCRAEVGSVSKMFGITGARIGWIATNDYVDYIRFVEECKLENCGVSVPSQDLVIDIFDKVDLPQFTTIAQGRINYNREELFKLNTFLDGQNIPVDGMFYCAWVDNKGLSIIDKALVSYIVLETETNRKLIRFNLAQNNTITKNAVKAILLADSLK